MSGSWSAPTAWDIVCRRAGGRRHHNALRRLRAARRRAEVVKLLGEAYTTGEIAAQLGVSRWTVWRDVKALMHPDHAPDCPACALWARVLR
jgi:DNA-binding CsgD family transcriptional regulator